MRCEKCGAELVDIQHGSGVVGALSAEGRAEYPKWIEALGRVVHSKGEEDEAMKPAAAPKTAVEGEAVAPSAPVKPVSELLGGEVPKTG